MADRARAVLFDLYGTLFDVHSVANAAERFFPGRGHALSQLWRATQLQYTWLQTLGGRYRTFLDITRDALRHCVAGLGLECSRVQEETLIAEYGRLSPYPEVRGVLDCLRASAVRAGILSNGDPEMIDALLRHAGFETLLDPLLSVSSVRKFKTHPEAYALGPAALQIPPQQILFVSSNCWDAIGATWFGYEALWVNRSGQPPDALDTQPAHVGDSLSDLLPLLDTERR